MEGCRRYSDVAWTELEKGSKGNLSPRLLTLLPQRTWSCRRSPSPPIGLEQPTCKAFLVTPQTPADLFDNCLRNISAFPWTPWSPLWQWKQPNRKWILCPLMLWLNYLGSFMLQRPSGPQLEAPALLASHSSLWAKPDLATVLSESHARPPWEDDFVAPGWCLPSFVPQNRDFCSRPVCACILWILLYDLYRTPCSPVGSIGDLFPWCFST